MSTHRSILKTQFLSHRSTVGHTGVFSVIRVPGRDEPAQVLCFEDKKPDQPPKLFVMEVGRDKNAPGGVFRVTPQNIPVIPLDNHNA
jgi:clathrin heavy chain